MRILLALFFCLPMGLYAQNDKSFWVAGVWKVEKIEMIHLEPIIAKATPEKKKQIEDELKLMAQSASFEFNRNGNYSAVFSGAKEIGKWKLNAYASKLIKEQQNPDGSFQKPDEVGIEQLTKNSMVLLNDYETGEIIRMYLRKVK
ncbi:hypothetical protein [Raineya orbicola]|jgi:hypothetical protein|uniref:Lipocalin-like domain-containing protein n=1 Tax=Raineya orbicola TaxID=2016530 RepID=A0A2N3IJF2_9BACT|nr:hypothetical protein [Raineya orbicola]PKQ70470.1 hypothetical protein Rain11_0553 [Raineya orbicola]